MGGKYSQQLLLYFDYMYVLELLLSDELMVQVIINVQDMN
jgi:hypothetical protein